MIHLHAVVDDYSTNDYSINREWKFCQVILSLVY